MARKYPFADAREALINEVWEKGKPIAGRDRDTWRLDICGDLMKRSEHGVYGAKNGWQIDHVIPVAQNGSNGLGNLQPLTTKNNQEKGDQYPWDC